MKKYNAANMHGDASLNYLPLLALSIIFIIVELTGFTNLINTIVERILSIIEYSIRPRYLFFFSIGLIARQGKLDTMYKWIKHIITILLLLFTAIGFFFQNQILGGVIQYVFSICLFINIMQCKEKRTERDEGSVVEALLSFMGQNSFALYLWHVIGKSVGLMITGNHYNITYYVICIAWIALLCIIIRKFKTKLFYKKFIGAC